MPNTCDFDFSELHAALEAAEWDTRRGNESSRAVEIGMILDWTLAEREALAETLAHAGLTLEIGPDDCADAVQFWSKQRTPENVARDATLKAVSEIIPRIVTAPHPERLCRICKYDRTHKTHKSCAFCGHTNP